MIAAGTTTVSAVHPDILLTHILNLLDGPTLAATSCVSSGLHALISSDENLWRDICLATWPSVADPRLRRLIAAFPAGHRSFFSDSFPLLHRRSPKCNLGRSSPSPPPPSELISAVDIHYKDELVISRVVETKTASSDWFGSAPFRVDLVEGDHEPPVVRVPARFGTSDGACRRDLEENLTLSWIMVDPARNRAANLSSRKAVSVRLRQRWAGSMMSAARDDVEVRYATVVDGGGKRGSATELVEVAAVVTCMGKEGGEVHVRGASVRVEDMDGRSLSGEESLVILGQAMWRSGERRKGSDNSVGEERERYEEYMEMKRERRERKERREVVADMACMAFGFSIFFALWCFLLLR